MKIIYFLLSITILLTSCSEETHNNIENTYQINAYFFKYMDYPEGTEVSMTYDNNLARINYDNNHKILKRIGGFRPIDQATGFSYFFSSDVYDTISYSENQILVKQKLNSTIFHVPLFERKLLLNNQGKVIKKLIYREYFNFPIVDTVYYTYNSLGNLMETRKGKVDHITESSKYYFDVNKNLDSIVTKKYYLEYLEQKTVEIFSDFDNANNPLKNLFIFEETFNRSLSKNNYRKYEIKKYRDVNNYEEESTIKTWNLIYGSQGEVKFESY